MIRSSVRSAGLAILLTVNGCGGLTSSSSGTGTPALKIAQAALEGGSGQIALQVSEGVLSETPNNARALEIKADALTLLGDYDEASAIYLSLLAKDATSVRANTGLGRVRLTKDPAAAEALFQKVLNRAPQDLTALDNLGIARDLQGRHAEAQTAYRQALAVSPDLDSAQVNLALSMAMNGQGAEAIKLLRSKASLPNAPAKVRHDYAVVLAMAGDRAEAERVLSTDLTADETRQVLDSVTGTRTRLVREGSFDPLASGRGMASRQRDDGPPPDVLQVPETASPRALNRTASIPGPAATSGPAATAMTVARAAPPPMIVRPQAVSDPDSDSPVMQPVSPIAAAVTNQRTLALPMRNMGFTGIAREPDAAPDPELVTPMVVPMPPAPPARQPQRGADAPTMPRRLALPVAPPAPPVLPPAPLPPAYQPHASSAAEPPARQTATAADAISPETRQTEIAGPVIAQPEPPQTRVARTETAQTRLARAEPAQTPGAMTEPARTEAVRKEVDQAKSVPTGAAPTDVAWADEARRTADKADSVSATTKPVARTAPARVAHEVSATENTIAASSAPIRGTAGVAGSPKVQFAAAMSQGAAFSFWHDLVHRYPDVLSQREPMVIRFAHDGEVFWRVRTEGFATMTEAQSLCARMRADGQPCFVPHS